MIKRITLSIISFTILLSCSDDNSAKEENIIDENLIICENPNTKKLRFEGYHDYIINAEDPSTYGDPKYTYLYNSIGNLEYKNLGPDDLINATTKNNYNYNEDNQLTTRYKTLNSRELTEIDIDSFQYNTNGELIKHKFKNISYYTDGPDAETIVDSSMHENNFVYNDNLIKRNSSNYIRLNEAKKIETIFLGVNELTFQYDLNGNIISGTGKINEKDINIRVSYECFIKHPIFGIHTFNNVLTNEYPISKLSELFQDLVNLSFQYPTSIEWEITGGENYEVTYEYDFDLEGYPQRIKGIYYRWED